MDIFIGGFWILIFVCIVLYYYTRSALPASKDANFLSFQRSYLIVYLLAMAGDWLQGPYVYALYDHYGMSTHDIEVLFVAGFGSSMIFGTVIGSIADKYGRRLNCIIYGILYGLACVTKHFNHFPTLMMGRLLGGIATSILYSAFESWVIYEHNARGFDSGLLQTIFSHAVLGNSLVAIFSGVLAQQSADLFGYVAPFDLSLTVLVLMSVLIVFTWPENYGNSSANMLTSFRSAAHAIKSDTKVLCLGLIQSLFEGAMYTFVLEWTPALTPAEHPAAPEAAPAGQQSDEAAGQDLDGDGHRGTIPHGYIFAAFMVAIMIGSSLFKLLSKYSTVESFMRPVLFVAAMSLTIPIIYPGDQLFIFSGFLVFETCVGIFWPSLMTMRSKYVPEETRATIMNMFRVPLNLIVVIILTQNLPMTVIFWACVGFLLCAALAQQILYRNYQLLLPAGKSVVTTDETQQSKDSQLQKFIESAEKGSKTPEDTRSSAET